MTNLLIKIYNPKTQMCKSFVLINPAQIPVLDPIETGSILYIEVLKEGKVKRKKKNERSLEETTRIN